MALVALSFLQDLSLPEYIEYLPSTEGSRESISFGTRRSYLSTNISFMCDLGHVTLALEYMSFIIVPIL